MDPARVQDDRCGGVIVWGEEGGRKRREGGREGGTKEGESIVKHTSLFHL